MIAVDQQPPVGQRVANIVAEFVAGRLLAISPQYGVMGDGAERDDDTEVRHRGNFLLQVIIAGTDFGRHRLVRRRQAADGIGDARIVQRHLRIGPAVGTQWFRNGGKPKAVQRRIKQFAGHVASERAAGAIGAALARTQTDDQQARIEGAKRGNRQRMPVRLAVAQHGKVLGKPRARGAADGIDEFRHGGDVSMAAMQRHWDIFCRVIDNFGDIGVCWRLARQLACEHGQAVRLWVDDPSVLQPLCPAFNASQARQTLAGVDVRHWCNDDIDFDEAADVVIEAFACELPPAYLGAMASRLPRPCWLNLEYLSAEAWVEGCHGMASPHPTLPLVKYFIFPGFSRKTAGLLREADLLARRDACQAASPARAALEVSLFCYDTAPVGELLEAFAASPRPVLCHVPPGKPLAAVRAALGGDAVWQRGNARIEAIPFLPMDDYDRLLWRCDINFVRGEDSFVRGQWAARPFVWQVYRQDDDAHLAKLAAFLDCYASPADAETAATIRDLFVAWNTGIGIGPAWMRFAGQLDAIGSHNRKWSAQLAELPDLASSLVTFCAHRV